MWNRIGVAVWVAVVLVAVTAVSLRAFSAAQAEYRLYFPGHALTCTR